MKSIQHKVKKLFHRNRMMHLDFKFHPIGQGLFYSGIFTHLSGNQFSIVYDCGTDSSRQYINHEINDFTNELELDKESNDKLDIFFISHLHADHTNKIADLLKATNGAKYAILPYLNPDELLLAYTDYVNSGNYLDDDGNPDPNLLLFFSNPTAFLKEFRVDSIIFIHPDSDSTTSAEDDNPEKDDDPSSKDFRFKLINGLEPNKEQEETNSNVEHYFDAGKLKINTFWEFKFFNKPRSTVAIAAFKKDIEALITTNATQDNIANHILAHPKTFEKSFKTIYENHFGVKQLINQTSLVVYHGALAPERFVSSYIRWPLPRFIRRRINSGTGTLLSADICLDAATLTELRQKWTNNKYFDNVDICQVPHHGSRGDMSFQVFQEFGNVIIWLINFGLGNKHKLPHQDIINLLVNNGKIRNIFSNNQIQIFRYTHYLVR
tara:strand:+ start:354119 stop:355426 length:1308 start_codon:yes stop_codon:yes gene_type:complete